MCVDNMGILPNTSPDLARCRQPTLVPTPCSPLTRPRSDVHRTRRGSVGSGWTRLLESQAGERTTDFGMVVSPASSVMRRSRHVTHRHAGTDGTPTIHEEGFRKRLRRTRTVSCTGLSHDIFVVTELAKSLRMGKEPRADRGAGERQLPSP
ncbi:hypothetical protein BV25DRAFT_1365048 [Artomyces pyxidatus]|uniref:Uncharacterized protein n=1 Tax=Artomyces pyxidatus TaxID=48021 RepID=A0ACB8SNU6_9AGAM|nr:hypothetical protein BV25DRAFT_1365048 [Artomyces pyxidatus]